ncbi:MAG: GNAT family N-acetyltransferase [Chitinophagaceae bacterium]|nr:MAG: GNAT family N-acetyltransferase [Chitinophagaceae bacterium]
MGNTYEVRPASTADIPFLADAIIAADKGHSERSSFVGIFGVSEAELPGLISDMLDEEIPGCEFSVDSFLIATAAGVPVATFGAWIEGQPEGQPSKVLKSNLIGYTFGPARVGRLKEASVLSDLFIDREKGALQLEYLYVADDHRGKGLGGLLVDALIRRGQQEEPGLAKVQVQLYADNHPARTVYLRRGFEVRTSAASADPAIFRFLPSAEKIMMEKHL